MADPPWRFRTWTDTNDAKSARRHYALLETDDIKNLLVKDWAAPDCALFIWATWPTIFQTESVINAWGFRYSGLAWEWFKFNPTTQKAAFGLGYGTRKNLEPCLLALRGAPKLKSCSERDWLSAPRREHSRKPDEQYARIEAMYDGPYLEMFARQQRDGWDFLGQRDRQVLRPDRGARRMTHTLHIDFETRSTVDLRRCGVYVYAEDPSTDVLCAAYAVDDGPVELWTPRYNDAWLDQCPAEIICAAREGWTVVAHNANFERTIWREILNKRYGWPLPKLGQWRCTMAQALAMALPGSLENAAAAVGIEQGKDMGGRALMLQMSHPRRPRKGEDPNEIYWFEDEERLQRLYAYCRQDVEVERALGKRLLALRQQEQKLWQLDQVVNDRGVFVDTALCRSALKVVAAATLALDDEIRRLTDGAVSATTNVAKIARWCRLQGVQTESLAKEAVDELLVRQDLPPAVRRVLEIRREAAKAAVKKIDALLAGKSRDGRAKGLSQYHAASTGRSAGRRFQPKNIKRPDLDDIDGAIEAVESGDADYVRLVYGEPLAVVTDCLRGMVRAAPGRIIRSADFSNIEGRVQAWLAGEEWKLQAFRDFDTFILDERGRKIPDGKDFLRKGPDVYIKSVADLFSIPVKLVTKQQRQEIGKVVELASGYEGGIAAYLRFGIDKAFPILVPRIRADGIGEEWDWASERYHKSTGSQRYGLAHDEWCVVRIVVDRWRDKHGKIKLFWRELEDAAHFAIRHKGKPASAGRIAFKTAGSFLFMQLPSGRCITYPYPDIREHLTPWGEKRPAMSYMGVDSYTRKWTRCFAHGGLLFNNVVQGTARDIEAEAMLRLVDAGYETMDPERHGMVLEVYDEVVCETPSDFGSTEEFIALMTRLPAWAAGLPLAADGWSAERYRK